MVGSHAGVWWWLRMGNMRIGPAYPTHLHQAPIANALSVQFVDTFNFLPHFAAPLNNSPLPNELWRHGFACFVSD